MAEILRVLDMNYPRYNGFIRLLPVHYGINNFKILARGYEPIFSKYHNVCIGFLVPAGDLNDPDYWAYLEDNGY